jgi:hypothetical protein
MYVSPSCVSNTNFNMLYLQATLHQLANSLQLNFQVYES